MSVDTARVYIDDVKTRLGELFPADASIPFKIGRTTFDENDVAPIIKWAYGTIEHEPSAVVDTIGTEVQELIVRIWNVGADQDNSEANTRVLKNHLLLACRQVAQRTAIPDPVAFGSFDWNEEAHNIYGRQLEGSIFVRLGIPNQQFETVTIERVRKDSKFQDPVDGSQELMQSITHPPLP